MSKPRVPEKKKRVQLDVIDQEFHDIAHSLADTLAEEEAHKPNQVLPKKALQERYQQELEQEFSAYRKRLQNGVAKIVESLLALSKDTPDIFSQDVVDGLLRISGLSELIAKDEQGFIDQLFSGTSLQELAVVSDAVADKLYQGAKHLYEQKLYDDAADAFCFLASLNPKTFAFWLGLGNSEFCRKCYDKALWALAFACEADPTDPACHLISSRCYVELGEIDEAISSIDLALYVIEGRDAFKEWKPQLEAEKKRLSTKRKG